MSYLTAYSLSANHGLLAYNLSVYHDLSGKRWKLRRLLFNDQLYTIIFQENWYPNINKDNYQSPVRQKLEISKVKYNSTALKIKVHVSPLPVFTFTELHCVCVAALVALSPCSFLGVSGRHVGHFCQKMMRNPQVWPVMYCYDSMKLDGPTDF